MNILVINGSPKGDRSNTLNVSKSFIKGFQSYKDVNSETVHLSKMNIEPCCGCFSCWTNSPGNCVIKDDMIDLIERYIHADLVIWSLPLYFFSMPSKAKAFMDRLLPMFLPFMEEREDGGIRHPYRDGRSQKEIVLITTCGFASWENNYEALIKQFEILYGKAFARIACPEGELFARKELIHQTAAYLSVVENAGKEYAEHKIFLRETNQSLSELMIPKKAFIQMADASWDIKTTGHSEQSIALRFTLQIAALYDPTSFKGERKILEMYYTDVEEVYQLVLDDVGCKVLTTDFLNYTTRVETPLTVWQDISMGKYTGEEAMMAKKYRTLGDLKLLIAWQRYFGGTRHSMEKNNVPSEVKVIKKTHMSIMLTAWLVIWSMLSINPTVGGIAGISVAVFAHFANYKWELTVYDHISFVSVAAFSVFALVGFNIQWIVPLSYLGFGLMWLFSCFTRVPLTAHYSKNDYNGNEALKNPLFIKTNFILTLCWSMLYLITPIWTYYIMKGSMPYLTPIINSFCPIILGVFTKWFQQWYPAKIAKG